jgi:hypothetical protein
MQGDIQIAPMLAQQLLSLVRARGLTINRPNQNKFLLYHVVFRCSEVSARLAHHLSTLRARTSGYELLHPVIDVGHLPSPTS